MTSKKSNLHLYDELGVKRTSVKVSQVKTLMEIPDYLELNNKLTLTSRTNTLYNSLDVGKDLNDLKDKDIQQDTALNGVEADINVLDGKIAAVEADLLGKTAGIADLDVKVLALETSDNTQNTRLDGVENINSTQAGLITQEIADRAAADANLQSQLDALGVVDTATLAQINQMLIDYQAADSSIAVEQAQQNTRLTAIENTLQTLLNPLP